MYFTDWVFFAIFAPAHVTFALELWRRGGRMGNERKGRWVLLADFCPIPSGPYQAF